MDPRLVIDILNQLAALSRCEGQTRSNLQQQILSQLLQVDEKAVDTIPLLRKIVATGIAPLVNGHFVLEEKAVLLVVFAESLKRCALLWNLLLKKHRASSSPQRLLLKLEYCQRFTSQVPV